MPIIQILPVNIIIEKINELGVIYMIYTKNLIFSKAKNLRNLSPIKKVHIIVK